MNHDLELLPRALQRAADRGAISTEALAIVNRNVGAAAHAANAMAHRVSGISSGTAVFIKYVGLDDSGSLIDLAEAEGFDVVRAICAGVNGNIQAARDLKIANTLVTVESMKAPRPKIANMELYHPQFPDPAVSKLRCDGGTPLFDFALGGLAYVVALMEQLQFEADRAAALAGTTPRPLEFIVDMDWFGDGCDTTSFATANDVASILVPMRHAGHTFSGYGVGGKFAQSYLGMGIPASNIHRVEARGIARAMIAGGRRSALRAITGRQ